MERFYGCSPNFFQANQLKGSAVTAQTDTIETTTTVGTKKAQVTTIASEITT
ncbi:MAG: hypothetical protein WC819_04760 [Parcubacteria group bacterium]|jgi:hypothetical protein